MDPGYESKLITLFGCRSRDQIKNAIEIVLQSSESANDTEDEKLESMINILVESGDSTNYMDENNLEGAVGCSRSNYDAIKNIFADISEEYLQNFCLINSDKNVEEMIELLIDVDYQREESNSEVLAQYLKEMLPDADPTYLEKNAKILSAKDRSELEIFIQHATEKHDYPKYQDYLKNLEVFDALAVYKEPFRVDKFLEVHSQPLEEFTKADRKYALADNPEQDDIDVAKNFLYYHFNYLRKNDIERVFNSSKFNLVYCNNILKRMKKAFRQPRASIFEADTKNMALLQEIAFIRHEKDIRQYIKQKDERYNIMFQEAKKYGLLETCLCCYDEELIPEEVYFCKEDCKFCKSCVRSGALEVIGRGGTDFPCLSCKSEFSYHIIKMVLEKKIFTRLCQRKQVEEIKAANLDGLENCPFCDFSTIPPEGDKLFKCENPECMKESCRECLHPSHVPLKCNEVEYDEDVKMRTYIENKMTEALVRKCKCGKIFIKENGCNKMTCACGTFTCYVCGQTIRDYQHFGEIAEGRCPLYIDNLDDFHSKLVLTGALSAKKELGVLENPNKLKFDPTKNFQPR